MIKQMPINWTNLQKKYKGLWVALAKNEVTVIASGKTAREALERAKAKSRQTPILTRMPEKVSSFVG
ncbi:MAG: DUF5678 domain-containing protein [Candidatus Zambryskibacteria bacterium]|nr:DUF5678 domain-containing protein [Candidatus Zambryskibacteria bacterium]